MQTRDDKDSPQKVTLGKDTAKKFEVVTCPYEPKNQVLKHKLQEHLKTCPKRLEIEQIEAKSWFSKGINFMNPDKPSNFDLSPEEREASQLKYLDPGVLRDLTKAVETGYQKVKDALKEDSNFGGLLNVDKIVEAHREIEGDASELMQKPQ